MYRVDTKGLGDKPKLCEEFFTNIYLAKRAIATYKANNAPTMNKKRIMEKGIERRQAAFALKNGELEVA